MKLIPEAIEVFTHQNYENPGIEGVSWLPLARFSDDGGSLTELARLDPAGALLAIPDFHAAQITHATIEPGVIKAFHVHERQRDLWFVAPEDRVLLVLVDVRDGSPTARRVLKLMLGDGKPGLVGIPPGVAHGCRNVGGRRAGILYLTDRHFSPDPTTTDEGRLPWDLVGAEIWEPAKE
jgi:dTDP-4-dehydrorhamnose 3,5-epimerase